MSPSGLQSPSQPPTQAGPSVLAGGGPSPEQGAGPSGGGEESSGAPSALRDAVQELRSTEMKMTELAGRFPAAAQSLRQATTSIRAALRSIIANPGQPEPRAPSIGG